MVLDIPPGPRKRSYAGTRIALPQLLDGSWRGYLGVDLIVTQAATTGTEVRPVKQRRRRLPSAAWNSRGAAPAPRPYAARLPPPPSDRMAEQPNAV